MIKQDLQTETETSITLPLPTDRLEPAAGWGGANRGMAYVYRPSTVGQLRDIFSWAAQNNRTIGLRGGGNSYGDAAMNDESILLDFTRMNRILEWDPENGRLTVEPGVTLQRVWEYVIEDGWWVPVATGTANITVGGGASMNVHGKNAWKMGTFGEHVYEFDLMLPSGEIKTCNRQQNSDLFFAAIGGFGMLGCFTRLTLHLKRVYSGLLQVEALIKPNLGTTMQWFEDHLHNSDYLVGWLDAFSKGKQLGRSELHRGLYLRPGEDPNPSHTLRLEYQRISPDIMGFFPRSALWRFQRPFWNNFGMRWVNFAKFRAAKLRDGKSYREPHAHFHFLLDSLDWRKPFGPGGLIQYQPFIPKDNAETAFTDILQRCQQRGLPNFLTVMKRHRPDPFWLTHGLDGYSLAMDFRITAGNRARVVQLARELDEIVLLANGRFYLAKDSTLRPEVTRAYLGEATVAKFMALKQQVDPETRLQSNMWRRLFTPL